MKRSLIVAAVFGIASIALFNAPRFLVLVETDTIGEHDVDLSKSGQTVLPIPDVQFCCGSELLLFLDASVDSDPYRVTRELLKPANLTCEVLVPDEETELAKTNRRPSWSGSGAAKRLFLAAASPLPGQGRSVRLQLADGCPALTGVKQTLVLRQTPCAKRVVAKSIPFLLGGFGTGVIAAIALIVTLIIVIKNRRSGKTESNKTLQ